jgi:hypothetical protein
MSSNQYDLQVYSPQDIRLFRSSPGDASIRMTVNNERSWYNVRVSRAFPFSDPDGYIGFRDGNDAEIGMIENAKGLDAESRAVLETELERRYFTPKVTAVSRADEIHGLVTFSVTTDRGDKKIVIRNLRDHAFQLGPNRLMLVDIDGNRYELPDVRSLGPVAISVLAKVI